MLDQSILNHIFEEMRLGAWTIQDMSNIATERLKQVVSHGIEEGGAEGYCLLNTDLVNAQGLDIILPVQAERAVAVKAGDLSEIFIGNMPISGVTAKTYVIAAKATWSHQVEKAKFINYMANEITEARNSIIAKELELLVTALGLMTSDIAAAAAGTFAYADIIAMRKSARIAKAPTPYFFACHPDQMQNLFVDTGMIDSGLIAGFSELNLNDGNKFHTKQGFQFLETTKVTATTTYIWAKNAIEYVKKTDLQITKYDKLQSGEGFEKGVILWKMLEIKNKQPTWGAYMDDA